MATTIDVGTGWLHPPNKQDVGLRLAQWALHQTYGKEDLVPSGPIHKSHKIEGNKVTISYEYVGQGLMVGQKSNDLEPTRQIQGKLKHFSISGADKKWYWADAKIDGDKVVLTSDKVLKPVAVRYAFADNPTSANLYNKDGLPASPFRTDDWPLSYAP